MSYQITITRTDAKTTTRQGEWRVLDEVPWTRELLNAQTMHESTEAFLAKNPLKRIHGYGPAVQATETETVEVLKQTVDELDLAAVIKAINNL